MLDHHAAENIQRHVWRFSLGGVIVVYVATTGEPGQMGDVTTMVEVASRNVQLVSNPLESQLAANEIAKIAVERHVAYILAASSVAEQLVAPTRHRVLCQDNGAGHTEDAVLLFDINFASGTSLSRAAARARKDGASTVYGVVLYQLSPDAPTAHDCGLDELLVLRVADTLEKPPVATSVTQSGILV